eukprot:345356-Rhodomonas_salina.1
MSPRSAQNRRLRAPVDACRVDGVKNRREGRCVSAPIVARKGSFPRSFAAWLSWKVLKSCALCRHAEIQKGAVPLQRPNPCCAVDGGYCCSRKNSCSS